MSAVSALRVALLAWVVGGGVSWNLPADAFLHYRIRYRPLTDAPDPAQTTQANDEQPEAAIWCFEDRQVYVGRTDFADGLRYRLRERMTPFRVADVKRLATAGGNFDQPPRVGGDVGLDDLVLAGLMTLPGPVQAEGEFLRRWSIPTPQVLLRLERDAHCPEGTAQYELRGRILSADADHVEYGGKLELRFEGPEGEVRGDADRARFRLTADYQATYGRKEGALTRLRSTVEGSIRGRTSHMALFYADEPQIIFDRRLRRTLEVDLLETVPIERARSERIAKVRPGKIEPRPATNPWGKWYVRLSYEVIVLCALGAPRDAPELADRVAAIREFVRSGWRTADCAFPVLQERMASAAMALAALLVHPLPAKGLDVFYRVTPPEGIDPDLARALEYLRQDPRPTPKDGWQVVEHDLLLAHLAQAYHAASLVGAAAPEPIWRALARDIIQSYQERRSEQVEVQIAYADAKGPRGRRKAQGFVEDRDSAPDVIHTATNLHALRLCEGHLRDGSDRKRAKEAAFAAEAWFAHRWRPWSLSRGGRAPIMFWDPNQTRPFWKVGDQRLCGDVLGMALERSGILSIAGEDPYELSVLQVLNRETSPTFDLDDLAVLLRLSRLFPLPADSR